MDLRGRETSIFVPLIYEFVGWFSYVPWPGAEPAILMYEDRALTNRAIWPRPINYNFLIMKLLHLLKFWKFKKYEH